MHIPVLNPRDKNFTADRFLPLLFIINTCKFYLNLEKWDKTWTKEFMSEVTYYEVSLIN